ncbi:MAG TPA: ABC transporter ATP-binding protein [Candidatus Dormibacteraeota bacterium]|nr:ABC transporter ATP-binding protein [Candidatus Dormibacteraeota bacterium]
MSVAGGVEALRLEGVVCTRGRRRALDGVSLTLDEGRVLGVVGPNGAGKTTLIELVCGLLRADQGRVWVLGRDASRGSRELRRQVGLVAQETALYEEVSGRRNLRFAADLYGVPRPAARVAEVLELIGLSERADDPVATYSGGMRRRLAIGRALLHRPRLLILDEPTLGVDVEARHQIWMELRGLRSRGASVLLATNYLDEAEALCDEVAVLRQGRLVARDTPEGLIARAGRCVDLEVEARWRERLRGVLAREPSVLRVEVTDPGLTVSVRGPEAPDALVRRAMDVAPLRGFRLRPPDLAEVLRMLEAEGAV